MDSSHIQWAISPSKNLTYLAADRQTLLPQIAANDEPFNIPEFITKRAITCNGHEKAMNAIRRGIPIIYNEQNFKQYNQKWGNAAWMRYFRGILPSFFATHPFQIMPILSLIGYKADNNGLMHGLKYINKIQNNKELVQKYLDTIGIQHFTADQVIYLPYNERMFVLTHFYGYPYSNTRVYAIRNYYLSHAKTNEFARIVGYAYPKIAQDSQPNWEDKYVNIFNCALSHPENIQQLVDACQAQCEDFLKQEFHLYFKLFSRQTPPPLSPDVLRQNSDISMYTDKELKTYFPYNGAFSRSALIKDIHQAINEEEHVRLFKPSNLQFGSPETQTSIYSLTDFKDFTYHVIGIGTYKQGFRLYDIQDILQTLDAFPNLIADPYQPNTRQLSLDNLQQIIDRIYVNNFPLNIINQLCTHVSLRMANPSTEDISKWINEHPEYHIIVEEVFIKLFELGMYLRRWAGPGHKYPLNERLTEGDTFTTKNGMDVGSAATICGAEYADNLNKLPSNIRERISNLHIINKYIGNPTNSTYTIHELVHNVQSGDACIRMASSLLSYTGAFYMKIFLQKQPPGFDIHQTNIAEH